MIRLALSFFAVLGALPGSLRAGAVTFQSGPARTHLLELYTSEGCSSCPPAERWLSTLRQDPRLWKEIVPIAFHVDYWDNLGWKDSLASNSFTARQYDYAASWGSESVYTPEFVLDGQEWRDRGADAIPAAGGDAGTLAAACLKDGEVRVSYSPPAGGGEKWVAHVALLGFGIRSNVHAGENGGRTLVHDFAALSLQAASMMTGDGHSFHAVFHLPAGPARHCAIAAWVSRDNEIAPVQAIGGDL